MEQVGRRPQTTSVVGAERRREDGDGDRAARARTVPIDPRALARGLGWTSIALGVMGTLAPRQTARMIGVRDRGMAVTALRLVGLRELASGFGILTHTRPAGWVWSRVAGDAVDLALLGVAFLSPRTDKSRLMAATTAVAGVTALDVMGAAELSRGLGTTMQPRHHAVALRAVVTVGKPAEELYRFWRDFGNMPKFMRHVESVEVRDDRRSHWRARGPGDALVEWDSEVIAEQPNELIAWRSLPGAPMEHEGTVRFQKAPRDRGTEVTVEMEYTPPGGVLGAVAAKLIGRAPDQELSQDLRRFKALMETGEIPVSEGVLRGAAQPPGSAPSIAAPITAAGGWR